MIRKVSHDQITRFLSQKNLGSKELWKLVLSVVGEYEEEEDGVINHFALRNHIYIQALQQAMSELHLLKSA